MVTVTLGKTGLQVEKNGFGCLPIQRVTKEEAAYLLLFGDRRPEAVCPVVKDMLRYIAGFSGDIPGASPISCGNWREQNPDTAKYYAARYLDALENAPRFTYPDP